MVPVFDMKWGMQTDNATAFVRPKRRVILYCSALIPNRRRYIPQDDQNIDHPVNTGRIGAGSHDVLVSLLALRVVLSSVCDGAKRPAHAFSP